MIWICVTTYPALIIVTCFGKPLNVNVNVYLYTAHITSCLMAVYNSIE